MFGRCLRACFGNVLGVFRGGVGSVLGVLCVCFETVLRMFWDVFWGCSGVSGVDG